MRKLKEVLRLHSLGLSQHQIARSCSISQSTVHEYLSAAQAAGGAIQGAKRRRMSAATSHGRRVGDRADMGRCLAPYYLAGAALTRRGAASRRSGPP